MDLGRCRRASSVSPPAPMAASSRFKARGFHENSIGSSTIDCPTERGCLFWGFKKSSTAYLPESNNGTAMYQRGSAKRMVDGRHDLPWHTAPKPISQKARIAWVHGVGITPVTENRIFAECQRQHTWESAKVQGHSIPQGRSSRWGQSQTVRGRYMWRIRLFIDGRGRLQPSAHGAILPCSPPYIRPFSSETFSPRRYLRVWQEVDLRNSRTT